MSESYDEGYEDGYEDACNGKASSVTTGTKLTGALMCQPESQCEYEEGYEDGYSDGLE
jgi:hypothetical protein